jgi:Immunity protein 53
VSRDVLTELQEWYLEQCNDEWEHDYGVTIGTLDNPGWTVRIDLADTPFSSRDYQRVDTHRTEHDWVVTWREDQRWCAACGPRNLGEAIATFLDWARA